MVIVGPLGNFVSNQSTAEHSNVATTFDVRPSAINKWVAELPLGSTGESSKQLYHAIKKVNQQQNSLEHHLQFLESISPVVSLLYPRLSKYFTDVSLPLGKKTRNVLHVTNCLLTEILRSYHSILKKLITKKPFGWKKPFALTLHRTLIYTSQLLCTQRLSYQPYTKGIWKEIFWCYQQAEKLKLLNKNYRTFSESHDKSSIEYEFKKLVLLSLLPANNLGQKNMREVYNLMPLWIKHSDILTKEPNDKNTCFTLNLLSDVSPYLIGTRNDNTQQTLDRHYLSTNKLNILLSNYLNKIDEDGSVRIGKNILSQSTIQSLLSSWSRNKLRAEIRQEGKGFVDIITGITAIHFVLNQQDQPAYDEVSTDIELPDNVIEFESTLTIEPVKAAKNDTLNLEHFLSNSDQSEDVWGKVYENNINANLPEANWTESGIYKVYNFTKSILLDYSKDGYRLSVNANKIDSLKHNELIAVREHALAPWALAQVKWLHFSERGDVQFGLRILTHHVLPVNIRYKANGDLSKPLPCLLGLDRKNLMLFAPTLPTDLKDKKIQLEHQKQCSHIELKNKTLTTSAFDVYEIHEPKSSDKTSNQIIKEPDMIINSKSVLSDNIWENL